MVDSDLSNEEIDSLLKDLGEEVDTSSNKEVADSKKGKSDSNSVEVGKGSTQVKKVDFSELSSNGEDIIPSNIRMLLEVPMDITVELGRTVRKVQDILSLNVGAVIELNKLSGEPVELLVNGKVVALAEVVVIDENFGVRITEIIDPENRIKFE